MPKRKQPLKQSPIIQSLEELISDYDKTTLAKELEVMKHGLGWKILRAALIKEYQNKVVYQMELCSKTGKQIEAAYESGCAQTMLDTATILLDKYIEYLTNNTSVTQEVRPEE